MKKNKFKIEYPLNNASLNILWNSIGTVQGLSEWFADEVMSDDNHFIFRWKDFEQAATLLHSRPLTYVRFQWDEDKGSDAYFEMKINQSELSKDMLLQVTDFAEPTEVNDTILLWNKQIENLKRATGL